MQATILSIGTELVWGGIVDTNAAWLARRLAESGVRADRHVTVGDDRTAIAHEIDQASHTSNVILTSGGLGPTADDLTRLALADVMGAPLHTDAGSLDSIQAYFAERNMHLHPANEQQALLPLGARAIANQWGTAPGIRARYRQATIYCMPGVPSEMRAMFVFAVEPEIQTNAATRKGNVLRTRCILCFGATEARIGELLHDLMTGDGPVQVGTTAKEAIIGVRLFAWAATPDLAETLLETHDAEVRRRLGDIVFGRDDDTLESVVARRLIESGATLATAESCTGGLLAKRLTDVPGSSAYFLRGYVTYANDAKTDLLGLPSQQIEALGAVSEPVAETMAVQCRLRSGVDFALSTTGIAGPGGGTADKPIGLVYVGLAASDGCQVRKLLLGTHLSREAIRTRTCHAALGMLRTRLLATTT